MAEFKVEDVKLTSKDADRPKTPEGYAKYPFKALEPGKCFYVPAETEPGVNWRKVFNALWAYNRRHNGKLAFKRMQDGRLCIFYPFDIEYDELLPTQFQFVQWLATIPESMTLELSKITQKPELLAEWIEEFSAKSGKALKYEINIAKKQLRIEVL